MAKQILLFLGKKNVEEAKDALSALSSISKNGQTILKLLEEQQDLMKNAWLTFTGYKRPGMKTGLPLNEAQIKSDELQSQIQHLLKFGNRAGYF
jgi:hypothetical protein